jgi:hypothetical protein
MTSADAVQPPEPPDTDEISDGYHTFSELYRHRAALFILLTRMVPEWSWRARRHEDGGAMYEGMFLAGMHLPTGDISYHMPIKYWPLMEHVHATLELAPAWDGHTSDDVLERLLALTP